MVNRAFDKIRQAGRGMSAVIIRLLGALAHVTESSADHRQRATLLRPAEMIMRGAEEEVREPNDLADIRARFERLTELSRALDEEAS